MGKILCLTLNEIGLSSHLSYVAHLKHTSTGTPQGLCRRINANEVSLPSLSRQLFGNQPRDSSRTAGHIYDSQWRIEWAYCKVGQSLPHKRTIHLGIKWVSRECLKGELVGFFCLYQSHGVDSFICMFC